MGGWIDEWIDADLSRSFSNGETVDSIETEKSRIVLHELEEGWWVLAVRTTRFHCKYSS